MPPINVILQAKARDNNVQKWLRGTIKLADDLAASMGRASSAMGSIGRGSLGAVAGRGGAGRGAVGRSSGGSADSGGALEKSLREAQRARERAYRRDAKEADRTVSALARAGQQRVKASQRAAKNLHNLSDAQLAEIETQREITARRKRAARSAAKASLGADPTAPKMGAFGKFELAENLAVAGGEFEAFSGKVEAGTRDSLRAFQDYEKAVVEVSTLTNNIPIDQIQSITTAAAQEFGGLPTDQVKGFYSIVSAGATNAADAQAQLTYANKLAIGGVATQEEAVLAISKSVANFKDQGVDAAQAADSLFTAVQRGQTTVEEMARALPNVASAAAASGLSLDETNAALAVLSTRLPNAKEAATSLKAAFSNLQKPTKTAREEAKRLGIDFSVGGIEAAGGIEEFLLKLRAAEKFDENTLAKLFDSSEARAAIANLISGMDDYRSVLSDMEKKQGAADTAYAKMADTTAQKMKQIEAQTELLKIQAGEALVPVLMDLTEAVMPIVTGLRDWIDENPRASATLAKLTIGIIAGGKAVGMLTSAYSMWSTISGLVQLKNQALGKSVTASTGAITASTSAATGWAKAAGGMKAVAGALPAIFAGAQVAILAFNVAMDNAEKTLGRYEDRIKGVEEQQQSISFSREASAAEKSAFEVERAGRVAALQEKLKGTRGTEARAAIQEQIDAAQAETAGPVQKSEAELLMERRNRLIETVNAAREVQRVGGGGAAFGELESGNVLEALGQTGAALINRASGVQEDFNMQRAQAERDLAAFDRQYGETLNLGRDAFTTGGEASTDLFGDTSVLADRLAQLIEATERVASNTATTTGPSMEAG